MTGFSRKHYERPPLPKKLHCNICGEIKPLLAMEFNKGTPRKRQLWTLAVCADCKSTHKKTDIPGFRTTEG